MKKISRSLEREIILMYMLDTSVKDLCSIYGLLKADVVEVLQTSEKAAAKRRLEVSTSLPGRRVKKAST